MKIVITGAGFIGSALAEHLASAGHDVHVVSRAKTWEYNVPNITYYSEDLTQGCTELEKALENADICICTAANVGTLKFALEPSLATENNIIDFNTMLALVTQENRPHTVIYLSSSSVYGQCRNAKEGDNYNFGQGNVAGYAAAKVNGEFLFRGLCTRGINLRIVRPFNVCGQFSTRTGVQRDGFLVSNLTKAAKENKPLKLYNNESRCYIDIHDVVYFLDKLVADSNNPEKRGLGFYDIHNVVNPKNNYTNEEVAELIKEMSGTDACIEYVPNPGIDLLPTRKGSNAKMKELYNPKVTLDRTIKNLLSL